jgi:6,7-dimethyl-8-ribityllumazine synthase
MNVLVIESRYYPAVTDALMDGATAALEKGGARFERLSVPGVLELAPAIAIAAGSQRAFDGYVALGCVLGEGVIAHTLFQESVRALQDVGVRGLAVGNGVLLAPDEDAALRGAIDQDGGGDAARAALALMVLRQRSGMFS